MHSSSDIFSRLEKWYSDSRILRLVFTSDVEDSNALATAKMCGHISAISANRLEFLADADARPHCTFAHPDTLAVYARVFSEKLGRRITVAKLLA